MRATNFIAVNVEAQKIEKDNKTWNAFCMHKHDEYM